MKRIVVLSVALFLLILQMISCAYKFLELDYSKYGFGFVDLLLRNFYEMSYPLPYASFFFFKNAVMIVFFCLCVFLLNIIYAFKSANPKIYLLLFWHVVFSIFSIFISIGLSDLYLFSPNLHSGDFLFVLSAVVLLGGSLLLYADILLQWRKGLFARLRPGVAKADGGPARD